MTIFEQLSDADVWDAFLRARVSGGHLTRAEERDLRAFVEGREYLSVWERLAAGQGFSLPVKKQLAKRGSAKKRTVYLFPREENYVLKLLAFLLERRYDDVFPPNLYSFRLNSGARRAFREVLRVPGRDAKYTYKTDISDYFNSIDVGRMVALLEQLLAGEERTSALMRGLLENPWVMDGDVRVQEAKGAMAGQPTAVFCANLYLAELDWTFAADRSVAYARYSDDILVLADTEAAREEAAARIGAFVRDVGLAINPAKEVRTSPGQPWTFLGLVCAGDTVDIAPVSAAKLKAKIRRRARAIDRWRVRKGASRDNAATALIRALNRKFFAQDAGHELTWSRWYFPIITTDATLRDIDAYAQDWIRALACGTHGKARYRCTYDHLKALGYRSLVHEWHAWRASANASLGVVESHADGVSGDAEGQ